MKLFTYIEASWTSKSQGCTNTHHYEPIGQSRHREDPIHCVSLVRTLREPRCFSNISNTLTITCNVSSANLSATTCATSYQLANLHFLMTWSPSCEATRKPIFNACPPVTPTSLPLLVLDGGSMWFASLVVLQ